MSDSKITALIAIAALIFGILIGRSFSGKSEDQKISAKKHLSMEIEQGEEIKAESAQLMKSSLSKESETMKEMLQKAAQEKSQLEDRINKLRGLLAHAELQIEAKEDFRAAIDNQNVRIHELENINHNLNVTLKKIASLTQAQESHRPVQPDPNIKADVPEAVKAEHSSTGKTPEINDEAH